MQTLQSRIDSFQKSKRVKKSSSSSASLKWPHPAHFTANPNTLAEAGFFFDPSWHDKDGVTCFLCGKEISHWDEDDDPFQIHYSKCRNSCAWALLRCGLTDDLDEHGRFVFGNRSRLPSTKAMEKARLDTFGTDWWPHDHQPGPTSIKMAQAGFVYTPQADGDDTVTCLYCNLSLGGWEEEDDPIYEHRTRDSKSGDACPFLALSSKSTRSKPAKKPPVEMPEQQSEDESADVPEPPPPRARRGKARSTSSTAAPKSRRKTRATRGRTAKASTPPPPPPPRSPEPPLPDPDETTIPDASMVVDVPPPEPDSPSRQLSLSPLLVNGSIRPLPHQPESPPAPTLPKKPHMPPPDTALKLPDPIVSLSPTGHSTIAPSKPLTHDERAMSLEQWIRQEIDLSHEKLMIDGQRQIELFKTRAAELRKCIDEL